MKSFIKLGKEMLPLFCLQHRKVWVHKFAFQGNSKSTLQTACRLCNNSACNRMNYFKTCRLLKHKPISINQTASCVSITSALYYLNCNWDREQGTSWSNEAVSSCHFIFLCAILRVTIHFH